MIHPSRNNRTPAHAGRTKTGPLLAASLGILFSTTLFPLPVLAAELPHHEITVTLDPGKHRLEAEDTITLPKGFPGNSRSPCMPGSSREPSSAGVESLGASGKRPGPLPLETFAVTLPHGANRFTHRIRGNDLSSARQEQEPGARDSTRRRAPSPRKACTLPAAPPGIRCSTAEFMTFSLTVELARRHGTR